MSHLVGSNHVVLLVSVYILIFSFSEEFVLSFTTFSSQHSNSIASSWTPKRNFCETRFLSLTNPALDLDLALAAARRQEFYEEYEEEFEDDYDYNRPQRRDISETKVVGRSAEEQELKNMRYEDEYDDDYDDEDDEEEYDEYYDDEEDDEEDEGYNNGVIGNFWNNPRGGLDSVLPNSRRNRDRENERFPNPSRRRERGSQRQTFRSGNPPAPKVMKDLYNSLFWYGFDPDETTTAADKTMFGGTKGKFNGLGLLRDINEGPKRRERRAPGEGRRRRRSDDDYYDEEEEEDDWEEDDYDEYRDDDDEEYEEMSELQDEEEWRNKNVRQIPPAASKRRPPARSQPSRSMPPLPAKDNNDSIKNFNDVLDITEETISYEDGRRDVRRDDRRDVRRDDRRDVRRDDRKDVRRDVRRKPSRMPTTRRRTKKTSVVSAWFDDDVGKEQGLTTRDENKRGDDDSDRASPIINLLDAVFQVDPDEVKSKADDYDRKLGLNKQNKNRGRSQVKRRTGYAYRVVEEDIDIKDSAEYGVDGESKPEMNIDETVIDVEASGSVQEIEEEDKQTRQKSWKEREQAYEQVPPKGVQAWGPEGDIGMDIFTFAVNDAKEEISAAKALIEKRMQLASDAECSLVEIKRQVAAEKDYLLSRTGDPSRIRRRISKLNYEIEDAARHLRRTRNGTNAARKRLEDLEDKHWALLSQHESDLELDTDAENNDKTEDDGMKTTGPEEPENDDNVRFV